VDGWDKKKKAQKKKMIDKKDERGSGGRGPDRVT